MSVKYFVKAAVSEYKDQSGAVKKKYQSIGVVLETKHGLMLKIENLPMFAMKEGAIFAYLNVPEEKGSEGSPAPKNNIDHIEEDIPF